MLLLLLMLLIFFIYVFLFNTHMYINYIMLLKCCCGRSLCHLQHSAYPTKKKDNTQLASQMTFPREYDDGICI